MHPWHQVQPKAQLPEFFYGVIEIPMGSKIKFEIDQDSGLIRVDRILFSSMVFPANYGIIPQSMGPDGDPYDILVLGQYSFPPLSLIKLRPLGLMEMFDQATAIKEIENAFLHYKQLNKTAGH